MLVNVAPAASETCTGSPYAVTQADLDNASINDAADPAVWE